MKTDLWFFTNRQTGSEILQPQFFTPRSQFGLYCETDDITFPFSITMTAYKKEEKIFEETVTVKDKGQESGRYNLIIRENTFLMEYWADKICRLPDRLCVYIKMAGEEHTVEKLCEYATISGKITDFSGKSFPASVQFFRYGFGYPYRIGVWSDREGNYSVTVPKGRYNAVFTDDESYRKNTLENWCWNFIIDRDEPLDFKVGTGEIYSLTPWFSNGGMPVMFLYFRPMMLGDKKEYTQEINGREYTVIDIAPQLEPKDIKVTVNSKDLQVISLQTFYETCDGTAMPACILQVEKPRYSDEKQRVTVEYSAVSDGNIATSQGRCDFYFRDGFVASIK